MRPVKNPIAFWGATMWFNPHEALTQIEHRKTRPADNSRELAQLARLARPHVQESLPDVPPEMATELGPRPVVLAEIRAGNLTPGGIAAGAKLGATTIYQLVAQLIDEGLVEQATNGKLSVTTEEVGEGLMGSYPNVKES